MRKPGRCKDESPTPPAAPTSGCNLGARQTIRGREMTAMPSIDLPFYCNCLTRSRQSSCGIGSRNNINEIRKMNAVRHTSQDPLLKNNHLRLYHCRWSCKNADGGRSHRQKFFAKAGDLTLSLPKMDLQNPVAGRFDMYP